MPSPILNFKSINPNGSRTLLLIHGAMSSHHEWDLVSRTSHLSSYHLLIPDLPSHGQSTSTAIPFNIPDAAALLADLISKHAENGKADIAGMSLGGYTAIYMANKYPDIIGEGGLFVTGCAQNWAQPGDWRTWINGLVIFISSWIFTHLPKSTFEWIIAKAGFKVEDDLYSDMRAVSSYQLGQSVMEALSEGVKGGEDISWERLFEGTHARTCVVAGALDDPLQRTTERGMQLKKGNHESKAFKVEGKRHAWDLQDPDLFAQGIKAWMDREEMPGDYLALD